MEANDMPKEPGAITAHITRLAQDQDDITTLVMTEAQVLELIAALTTGLREHATGPDGFRIALRKHLPTRKCQLSPPCTGGEAALHLVRPRKARTD